MVKFFTPFVKELGDAFIDAGTNLITTIHAPVAPASQSRLRGATTVEVNRPDSVPGVRSRVEVIRFRSPSSGPLLLNHILIVPHGVPMLTVVGQTSPLPEQCQLEAWASNTLTALMAPIDTKEELKEAIFAAGSFSQLQISEGSIHDSIVLVPQLRPLGQGQEISNLSEWPSLLLTDTIVIRGVYERLTICVFGVEMPEGVKWSQANERLWAGHISAQPRNDVPFLLEKAQKEIPYKDSPIDADDLMADPTVLAADEAMGEVSTNVSPADAPIDSVAQDAIVTLQDIFNGSADFSLIVNVIETLKDQLNWSSSAWDSKCDLFKALCKWAILQISEPDINTKDPARVVKLFDPDAPSEETPCDPKVKLEQIVDEYWRLPMSLKVDAINLVISFAHHSKPRSMGLTSLIDSISQAIHTDVGKMRMLRVAMLKLMLELGLEAPQQISEQSLRSLASEHAGSSDEIQEVIKLMIQSRVLYMATTRTLEMMKQVKSGVSEDVMIETLGRLYDALKSIIIQESLDGDDTVVRCHWGSWIHETLMDTEDVSFFPSLPPRLVDDNLTKFVDALFSRRDLLSEKIRALVEAVHGLIFPSHKNHIDHDLQQIIKSQKLLLTSALPPVLQKICKYTDSLDLARRAQAHAAILGGYENPVLLPEPCSSHIRSEAVNVHGGAKMIDHEGPTESLELVVQKLSVGLQVGLSAVVSARRSSNLGILKPEHLEKMLAVLAPDAIRSLCDCAVDALLLVAKNLLPPDLEVIEQFDTLAEEAVRARPRIADDLLNLADKALIVIDSLLFQEGNIDGASLPLGAPRPQGVISNTREIIDFRTFRIYLCLLVALKRTHHLCEGGELVSKLESRVLTSFALWHTRGCPSTRRWLLKEVMSTCRGTPAMFWVGLDILNVWNLSAFEMLKGSITGLNFSLVEASHPPSILPLHLSTFTLAALETTLDTAFFSTMVTLSVPSEVSQLSSVLTHPGPDTPSATEMKSYLCCHVPSANFAATDDRHICLVTDLNRVFSSPIFPGVAETNASYEDPCWDAVYEKLTRKVRDHLQPQHWHMIQTTTLNLYDLADFLHSLVFSLTDTGSVHLFCSSASCLAPLVAADLPILALLAERFKMVSFRALPRLLGDSDFTPTDYQDLNGVSQRLCQTALVLSLAPACLGNIWTQQTDTSWCGSVLKSMAKALDLVSQNLPLLSEKTSVKKVGFILTSQAMLFKALLVGIRAARQTTNLFMILSQCRPILKALIGSTKDLIAKEKSQTRLVEAVVGLLTECFTCPFARQLLANEMSEISLDGVSQTIFSEKPHGNFPATPSACANVSELFDCSSAESIFMLMDAMASASTDMPPGFFGDFLSDHSADDLLAKESGDLATMLHGFAEDCSDPNAMKSAIQIVLDRCSNDPPLAQAPKSVAGQLFWETDIKGKVFADPIIDSKVIEEMIKPDLDSLRVSPETVVVPVLAPNKAEAWLQNPVTLRKLGEPPIRVPESLDEDELPLRIEMENYEDPEAVGDATRQKRSVSAKAARLATVEATNEEAHFATIQQLPPAVPQPASIMDDWGAFATQVQRPPPMTMTPIQQTPMQPAPAAYPVPPPVQPDPIADHHRDLMAIPDFREFIQAGDRIGLPVLDILRNPGLLRHADRQQKFSSLIASYPTISGLFQSMDM